MPRTRESVKPDAVEAFCRALWRGEKDVVSRLAPVVDPNGRDRWGYTPLLMAVQHGDLALVSLLLERGADVDQGRRFLTPVTLAARRGDSSIVDSLRRRGAALSIFTWTHLGQDARVARALARDPSQAHLRDELGTPLLHHAVEALRPAVVELLLEHGAKLSDADPDGETPLHRLANGGHAAAEEARKVATLATLLLDRGADPNARNWDDVTPLHQAVRARNLAVAEVLLARGADPNARDKIRGSTPLRRAVSNTGASGTAGTGALMVPLTRLLLEHGADPDLRDKRGVPVHESARDPAVKAVLAEHRGAGRAGPRDRRAGRSSRVGPARTTTKRR